MTRTRLRTVLVVVFIVLCTKFDYCVTDDITANSYQSESAVTEEQSTISSLPETTTLFSLDSKEFEKTFFVVMTEKELRTEDMSTLSEYTTDFVTDTTDTSGGITEGELTTVFTTEEITTTQSPCQNDPELLKRVVVFQENDVHKIKWDKPTSEDCNKYAVSINGNNPKIIYANSIELNEISSSYCTKVDISAVDATNNIIGKAVIRQIPGKILQLKATSGNYEIHLTWDPPEDITCISKYFVYLNGEKSGETEETNFTIPDVEACINHKVEVSAVSYVSGIETEGVKVSESIDVETPTEFNRAVENLHLQSTLIATWEPPANTAACIERYYIEVWNQGSSTINYTDDTYFEIQPIIPCSEYSFLIIPQLSENINGRDTTANTTADPKVTDPPAIEVIQFGKQNVDFSVKPTDYSVNMCQITQIEINCLFSGDQLLDWMVPEVADSIPYSDSSSRPPADITVNGFSPYTDYSCEISVVNSAGKSNPTQIDVQTIEDVPSEPLHLQTKQEDDEINITWDEPIKIPGVLEDYKISVTYEASHHFIPKSCEISKGDVINVTTQEKNYLFRNFVPNSKYSVNVQAQTEAGYGNATTVEVSTNPEASKPVRNFHYNIKNYSTDKYNVSVEIAWQIPCNTNGDLIKFVYNNEGVSLGNDEPIEKVEEEIKPNENIESEDYSFEIPDIKPWVNYTIQIYAVTSGLEEMIGEINTVNFTSPEGWPSAPQNVVVDGITSTYGNIQWKEPETTNGEIQQYHIDIKAIKPLHIVSNVDCSFDHDDNVTAEGNDFHYEYNEFLPNYEYKVSVKAKTSVGFGDPQEITFETKTAPSEKVRSIQTKVITSSNENYDATLYVHFLQPCHLNGKFTFYKLTINGTRFGFEDHIDEVKQTEYFKNSLTLPLKPEYNYEGYVKVHTEDFNSEPSQIEPLTTLAGVPKETVMELHKPNSIEPESARFTLYENTFSNEMGEIIYYAVILAPEDYNPVENYGITNGSWPDIGRWSSDGELKEYQTTPKEWNPFNNTKRRSGSLSHAFTIGADKCEDSKEDYCNGPLRPGTSYSLRVRGFTSFGYRDTPKIIFSTPSSINYGALIGGIVGGAIGLILAFIIILVFWRRRTKSKEPVEETVLETLPLVPQPIPISKFVDHYADYKNNLNKLKSEYSLLERMGVSEQLPMTFAITDDNKRKNRYINVLPYDETRVKLDRDKNDNYTDYINASFIKGYSGNIEYIATQGPLESTVVDFWRMVIQENVAVIVMVAQFVEHDKAKCHQYFPNNHESMTIGDGIEIRCANEVPLGGYIKRTLMVQRELMQITITHLQYIEWPDFGCPSDTDSMLEFCSVFRQCVEQYKSKTIIHCSAGVGRTGTLIALDILIQTIENGGDIDIFKTVLNLRKQRVRMVQTEKQYMFIHNCLAEHISNPKKGEAKETEPIYENLIMKEIQDK